MSDNNAIWSFTLHLALLSLVAVGGVNTIVPELHRQVVEVRGALTAQQFADLFAIGQAAPGPNVLFVTLIGWQLAGATGLCSRRRRFVCRPAPSPSSSRAFGTASRMRRGASRRKRA